jgi:hypothetical protein
MAPATPFPIDQPRFCKDCRHSFRIWALFIPGALRCRLKPFEPDVGTYLATGKSGVDRSNTHSLCSTERRYGDCGPEARFFRPRRTADKLPA